MVKLGMFRHGHKSATTDQQALIQYWTRFPQANLGIATGAVSGVFVLDVDHRNGGDESLARLCRETGVVLDEPTVWSGQSNGTRGRHFYFAHPGGHVKSGAMKDYPGLDIKGENGYVVSVPSLHHSGPRYEFGPRGIEGVLSPAVCPPALLELLEQHGAWAPADGKVANIGLCKEVITSTITSTCSNYVRQFECGLFDEPWVRELLERRGPTNSVSWQRADFRRQDSSRPGLTYRYAQVLTGHLYRYAASIQDAEVIARKISGLACVASKWPTTADGTTRDPDDFVSTVISIYKGLLAKPEIGDLGAWRVGTPVYFCEEMLDALQMLKPPLRTTIYALECQAQRSKTREIHVAQPRVKRWLAHVFGSQGNCWDPWKHLQILQQPRLYRPRWSKVLTKIDDGYRVGKYGKLYYVEEVWTAGSLFHHVQAEEALGLPSLFEFDNGWCMPPLEMCYVVEAM